MEDMTSFLEPGDPGAFKDWPRILKQQMRQASHRRGLTRRCPVCRGNTGWNLQLDAYPLPRSCKNTACDRHMFAHKKVVCPHCRGWGWVHPDDRCPRHQWETVRKLGRLLSVERCAACGLEQQVDLSD